MKLNILIGSLGNGGAERVVSELLQNPPSDIEITATLFTLDNKSYTSGESIIYSIEDRIEYNILSKLFYKFARRTLFRVYSFYTILKQDDYDLSVSFLNYENCINLAVSKFLGIRTVVSIRNNPALDVADSKIVMFFQKHLLRILSPYLIVNSNENKIWIVDNYHINGDKCISIYNPKNINNIQTLAQESIEEDFFKTDEIILLTVGRLSAQKGHVHLLRIFSHLIKVVPCRLVICGKGELESSLKQYAIDLGISDSVYLTGWSDNPYKYMQNADIFVFPSLFEGQPNALIEAMICGCPIVSADCDYGPREILDCGKYGVLTKKLDEPISDVVNSPLTDGEIDFYTKVLNLIEHPELREKYSCLSKERIDIFNHEDILKKYYDVFRAAVNGESLIHLKD